MQTVFCTHLSSVLYPLWNFIPYMQWKGLMWPKLISEMFAWNELGGMQPYLYWVHFSHQTCWTLQLSVVDVDNGSVLVFSEGTLADLILTTVKHASVMPWGFIIGSAVESPWPQVRVWQYWSHCAQWSPRVALTASLPVNEARSDHGQERVTHTRTHAHAERERERERERSHAHKQVRIHAYIIYILS